MEKTWTVSQEDAMNLRGHLLLVSAAAGSGKTSVLTERIIRMLTDREHPAELSRLLIVTFTRAAAAELKNRIAKALSEALAEHPDDAHLSRQLLSLGSAHISTIDAFFQEEVRAGFAQLDLPASFRMADEAELNELALDTMEETLAELYEEYTGEAETDRDHPFARLRGNRFAQVMDHLLTNRRNNGISESLWKFCRRFANYPEGIGLLRTHADDLRSAAESDFFRSIAGKTVQRHIRELCADLLRAFDESETGLRNAGLLARYEGNLQSDADFCRALYQCDSYVSARAAVFSYSPMRLPAYRGEKPPALEFYRSARETLMENLKKLREDFFAWSPEEVREQLLLHAGECEMLYRLGSRFSEKLTAEKQLRGILSFDDVPNLFQRLLVNPDGSDTAYAKSVADRFDAVFIDEYQDVNSLQDRIFEIIGGDRRFMVGDIKQSIYGFRGGEPSIFAAYRRALPLYTHAEEPPVGGVCVFMSENFRCSQPVIDYANRICSFLFSACEDSIGYRPQDDLICGKKSPEGSTVPVRTVLFDPYTDAQKKEAKEAGRTLPNREALWVAAEVARLLREGKLEDGTPIRPENVAILMRNSTQMPAFTDALAAWGIPVSSPTADDLLFSPLMTDTLNLLRAIDNPYRDLPLSEYLLTPAGGFSLEELSAIRAAAPERRALYDAMSAAAQSEQHPCHEKAAAFLSWLEGYRDLCAVQPADRFLRLLFLDPRLSANAAEPELRILYEQARAAQTASWCGLYGFLERFSALCERGEVPTDGFRKSGDAVSVMTVHKSKGLEFPVVFLAGCGMRFSNQTLTEPLLFHKSVGCASRLFDPEGGKNNRSLLFSAVSTAIREDEREEEIRNLYVALTRARERLYVTGSVSSGSVRGQTDNTRMIRRSARSQILGASNRLLWILAALQERNDGTDGAAEVQIVPPDAVWESPTPESDGGSTRPQIRNIDPGYEQLLEEWHTFSYPFRDLRNIPTKAAASKLAPDLLDRISVSDNADSEESSDALNAAVELMQSTQLSFTSLLADRNQPKPTDIGTAIHTFLEACEFRLLQKNGVDAEIGRLRACGLLDDKTVVLLNRRHLELFRRSRLMTDILQAAEVVREQKFGMNLPVTLLTAHPERWNGIAGETVFVQGSIDLILRMQNGEIRLYDYKTDRISDEEKADRAQLAADLSARHGNQLACYARAVRELFGADPSEICIYSFPTGEAIPLTIDTHRFG